jgi:ATP-dependent Clp protease ATP-binding subunit ClpA
MISPNLESILNQAIKYANERKHEFLTLETVLFYSLSDDEVQGVFSECGVRIEELKKELGQFIENDSNYSLLNEEEIEELGAKQFNNDRLREIAKENGIRYQPEISQALQRVMQRAALQVQSAGKKNIQPLNLIVAMFGEKESHAVFYLEKAGVTRIQLVEKIAHGVDRPNTAVDAKKDNNSKDNFKKEEKYEKALKEFTVNLNELAEQGKIDPVIGREEEIKRVIQVLCRRRKNNPLLVGDAGVGKTAIAEGLALAIVQGKVPAPLAKTVVYNLDMASLLAGTKFRGDFEERLKIVIQAISEQKKGDSSSRVLFIDEVHTIIGAGSTTGGSLDASNLLKPYLSRGQLRCIGSTTFDEYRKVFEKDHALARRFQKIDVNEPSISDCIKILEGLKSKFEEHHGVFYSFESLKTAVELSQKYISDRKLPDKAIDVIDEAGSFIKLDINRTDKHVKVEDIEKTVSQMARIPEKNVSVDEKSKLQFLERDLKLLIFGQEAAIEKVTNAILLARSGLRSDKKTVASFLFAGPTGVGKTELAKQLAATLGVKFSRIDMSEYMEKHSVAKLIGAPPGYVGYDQGGILTEQVNQHPYCVLLLDEIEKAHPDVFNILLQVMDNGSLTDSNGRNVDFRNVILIMTSNAGAKEMEGGSIGLGSQIKLGDSNKRDVAIKNYFAPEFRNRLDAIVHFNALTMENIKRVTQKVLMELENQLLEKGIELQVSDEVIKYLSEKGYDPKLGARPIQRLVDEKIKKVLASEILFGSLMKGGVVKINWKNDDFDFNFEQKESSRIKNYSET